MRIKFHLTTTIQYFCCSHGNRSANVTSNVVRNIAGNVALCVRPFNTSHYETNNHDNKKYNLVVRKEEKKNLRDDG